MKVKPFFNLQERIKRGTSSATFSALLAVLVMSGSGVQGQLDTTDFPPSPRPAEPTSPQDHPFVGMWVTQDGHIRHERLSNGRYDEARGTRESAYQGRYKVTDDIIQYWDDTGFYADGQFQGGVLYHGGDVLLPAGVSL